ncbi:MBOAT family O-acyltransferase [Halomonas sp. GD1P12]|uniref:MBOAT family O-acyltransferase n=1 Tax=Halomonas sp. GD1P12 TaxID=2982691 RepID=UPI0021E42205|nr:MBOAT family protein [Halomonas sp. GD1P12]UYF98763.1 MBOAT family protein [Halomonas sp. GD1P12]
MVFSTPSFLLLYLPTVWLIYLLLARCALPRLLLAWLGVASLLFYAVWDIRLLPLLLASIGVNYWLAGRVRQRGWLWVGVAFNLGLLGWFKYSVFLLSALHIAPHSLSPLVLPLGISFFTFQQIAYLVDVRRGHARRETGSLHEASLYGVFVSFYPQLIAGPIVHYRALAPQLSRLGCPSSAQVRVGLVLLAFGLCKKLMLADNLAPLVERLFSLPAQTIVAGDTLVAGWAFGLQLYFDFSGYADMAMGLALLFGVRLPQNFASPYRAGDIQAFWRRWHITLSRFLRDYLYIPLGGSRHGLPRHIAALMVTMLLGGLWHGAGWQFLLWGGLHGLMLTALLLWQRFTCLRLPRPLGWLLTLSLVMLAWVPFRAESLSHTVALYAGLGQWQWGALGDLYRDLTQRVMALGTSSALLLLGSFIAFFTPRSAVWARWLAKPTRAWWQGAVAGAFFMAAAKAMVDLPGQAFLYFNF